MSETYNPAIIEPKWQEQWEADQLYRSDCQLGQAQTLCFDHAAVSQW
jgi:leucyl-tRNA synthetase